MRRIRNLGLILIVGIASCVSPGTKKETKLNDASLAEARASSASAPNAEIKANFDAILEELNTRKKALADKSHDERLDSASGIVNSVITLASGAYPPAAFLAPILTAIVGGGVSMLKRKAA